MSATRPTPSETLALLERVAARGGSLGVAAQAYLDARARSRRAVDALEAASRAEDAAKAVLLEMLSEPWS